MGDIRQSLLRRDSLSAAKELLYHLDIYLSGQVQNSSAPAVDTPTLELVEEFILHTPKDRHPPPRVTPHTPPMGGAAGRLLGWLLGLTTPSTPY